MKRKGGFTLVELLVVMAIIAILASIVVPNVISYIRDARATQAHSDIQSVEMAITKMLTDADRNTLHDLFDPAGVDTYLTSFSGAVNQFKAAQNLYTRTIYALLREGRQALLDNDAQLGISFAAVLKEPVVKKLGTVYLDLGLDPWDNLYQIFPGPWTANEYGKAGIPVIFRNTGTNAASDSQIPGNRGGSQSDVLTVTVTDPVSEETNTSGYSAPMQQTVYIWSYGENTINDQAINAIGGATGTAAYANPDVLFYGGGDDINNWDKDRTWERLYN